MSENENAAAGDALTDSQLAEIEQRANDASAALEWLVPDAVPGDERVAYVPWPFAHPVLRADVPALVASLRVTRQALRALVDAVLPEDDYYNDDALNFARSVLPSTTADKDEK